MKGVTLPTETVFVMENSPIKFGLGAMDEIGFDASRLGIRKALVFTDRHVAELGLPERVRALLEEQGVKTDVWDGVEVEPTDRSMEEAGDYARSKEFDGLIAVGGGSTIDTCKAANLLTCYPAPLLDYINKPVGKGVPVPGPLRPLIAVPTTAGTGSEVGRSGVVTLKATGRKTVIFSPYLMAKVAVLDSKFAAEEVYFEKKMACHHGGIVKIGDWMYSNGAGPLLCMDFMTGNIVWQNRSVGKGSLVAADGMLYVLGEKGKVGLVRPTPTSHDLTSTFKIPQGGDGPVWAHPVVCGGRLYIRLADDSDPNQSVVEVGRIAGSDPKKPAKENWAAVLPEKPEVLLGANTAGGQLFGTYLVRLLPEAVGHDVLKALERVVDEAYAGQPLHVGHAVPARHHEPDRKAVLHRERRAVHHVGDEHVGRARLGQPEPPLVVLLDPALEAGAGGVQLVAGEINGGQRHVDE